MNVIIATLISLAVGVTATLIISQIYYRKANKKSLTPYIRYATSVFEGMDPLLRERLKIRYEEDVEVEDLYQFEVLVLNDGFRAIKDLIEPLSLDVSEDAEVLDARIVHIEPEGRSVEATVTSASNPARVEFPFHLLNRGEYFLTKLLYRGDLRRADMSFKITAEDLPPELEPKSFFELQRGPTTGIEWGTVAAGVVMILLSGAIGYVLYLAKDVAPEVFPFTFLGGTFEILTTPAVILSGLGAALLLFFGLVAGIGETLRHGFRGFFQQTPPVELPEEIPRMHWRFISPWAGLESSEDTVGQQAEG